MVVRQKVGHGDTPIAIDTYRSAKNKKKTRHQLKLSEFYMQ